METATAIDLTTINWLHPDGEPDPSWVLVTAPTWADAYLAANRAIFAAARQEAGSWTLDPIPEYERTDATKAAFAAAERAFELAASRSESFGSWESLSWMAASAGSAAALAEAGHPDSLAVYAKGYGLMGTWRGVPYVFAAHR